jgi:hypothetical protein
MLKHWSQTTAHAKRPVVTSTWLLHATSLFIESRACSRDASMCYCLLEYKPTVSNASICYCLLQYKPTVSNPAALDVGSLKILFNCLSDSMVAKVSPRRCTGAQMAICGPSVNDIITLLASNTTKATRNLRVHLTGGMVNGHLNARPQSIISAPAVWYSAGGRTCVH